MSGDSTNADNVEERSRDEGNICVLPGNERVRELLGEKLDLNGHLHYSIDVEEDHGVEGVKGLCMIGWIHIIKSF